MKDVISLEKINIKYDIIGILCAGYSGEME